MIPGCEVLWNRIRECGRPAEYWVTVGCMHEHIKVKNVCQRCLDNWNLVYCRDCDPDHLHCPAIIESCEKLP